MKRLFLILLAAITFVACDNGEDGTPKPIELTGGTQTTQIIYADETEKPEGIKFKATAEWRATVRETTKAADKVSWLRLSADAGKAGDVTLAILLDQNDTGKDRKAEILITCGGATITIIVEQKATNKPEDPDNPEPEMRYVKKIISKSTDFESEITFEYDNQMRIAKMINKNSDTHNGVTETLISNAYFTYKDNTISFKTRRVNDGIEQPEEEVAEITLNPDGTAKQVITTGFITEDEGESPEPTMFSPITRSTTSKAPTITEFKFVSNYTYAQGYVISVDQYDDDEGPTKLNNYLVSWSNGNLSKVQSDSGNGCYDEFKYSTIKNKPCNLNLSLIAGGACSSEAFTLVGVLGGLGKQSKYMPSSLTYTDNIISYGIEFNYTVDKEGYVVSYKETGIEKPNENPDIPIFPYNYKTYTIEYVK